MIVGLLALICISRLTFTRGALLSLFIVFLSFVIPIDIKIGFLNVLSQKGRREKGRNCFFPAKCHRCVSHLFTLGHCSLTSTRPAGRLFFDLCRHAFLTDRIKLYGRNGRKTKCKPGMELGNDAEENKKVEAASTWDSSCSPRTAPRPPSYDPSTSDDGL